MSEKLCIWLSWKLPKRLVYWCAIRVMTNATVGKHERQVIGELTCATALQRWPK
jgi:hypothetical protein